jgi:hypothetical protein
MPDPVTEVTHTRRERFSGPSWEGINCCLCPRQPSQAGARPQFAGDSSTDVGDVKRMISMKKTVHVLFLLSIAVCATGWAQIRGEETPLNGDEGANKAHLGYPQDWSSRHLVMAGEDGKDPLRTGSREPRHIYNRVMREVAEERGRKHPVRPKRAIKVDWSVSLENGFVPANQFPAKYRFDVSTESCSGDYVVFGLTVNSGTQANLVGINNLYTEASPKCNSGTPFVAFAYNTVTHSGGQIRTSPTISADGTKVAFVESTTGGSYFHVLVLPNPLPSGSGAVGSVRTPSSPSSCTTPTTANCMTTTAVFGGTNTDSSPWIDYNTDTAYVGTDDGKLYKISPVFGGGAPTVAADTNWPVTVVTSGLYKVVTDPIVDDSAGRIFMGDANGYLYAISLTAPAKATAARTSVGWTANNGAGTGVVDPPIVANDSANPMTDQVFAFTGCSNVLGIGGAVSQLPATFATGSCVRPGDPGYVAGYCTTADMGSASNTSGGQPAGDCTTGNVHSGSFDNQFWINGTTGGHMLACGFVQNSGTTWLSRMYMFPFDSNHLITATGATGWNLNSGRSDECSPLTEFYNGTTDRLFFGVGSTTDGFIETSTLTSTASTPSCSSPPTSTCVTTPHALGGTSGIVVDNQLSNGGTNIYFSTLAVGGVNGQKCNVSGGTANPFCAVKLTQLALQ